MEFFNRHLETNGDGVGKEFGNFQQIYLKLLNHQRDLLNKMNHRMEFDEELIRKYLSLIDLEEFKLREKLIEA
jgi:CPA1 family monovalent cation:H+ antiporter